MSGMDGMAGRGGPGNLGGPGERGYGGMVGCDTSALKTHFMSRTGMMMFWSDFCEMWL